MRALLSRVLGQGLIETLLVVLFITASIVAFTTFQRFLSSSTSFSQQQSTATLLAIDKLERLRNYQTLNSTPGVWSYQDIVSGSGTGSSGNTTYNLTWSVTPFTNPTYKRIDVQVTWTDREGGSRAVRLISNVVGVEPAFAAVII